MDCGYQDVACEMIDVGNNVTRAKYIRLHYCNDDNCGQYIYWD